MRVFMLLFIGVIKVMCRVFLLIRLKCQVNVCFMAVNFADRLNDWLMMFYVFVVVLLWDNFDVFLYWG